jgi:5-methylcytosine-specific restriction endonuclease McrA
MPHSAIKFDKGSNNSGSLTPKAMKWMKERDKAMASRSAKSGEKARDYAKEYEEYHSKPEQKKNRAKRNTARRKLGLEKGDGKEVDHKNPLSKGGGNGDKNLRAVSRKTNREKGAKEGASGDKAAYKAYFEKKLKAWGIKSPKELDDAKKRKFFEEVDKGWKADSEAEMVPMDSIGAVAPAVLNKAKATARLMKKAGTSAGEATKRLKKHYSLSDAEVRSVVRAVYGKG